jgi:hypothetical protein
MAKIYELPAKYRAGFLNEMDGRTRTFEKLHAAHCEILTDLGGADNLSHVQKSLVERYVFLEFFLRNLESKIASESKESGELLGRWVQAVNSFLGLAKTIGLERRAKKITNLSTYIKEQKHG